MLNPLLRRAAVAVLAAVCVSCTTVPKDDKPAGAPGAAVAGAGTAAPPSASSEASAGPASSAGPAPSEGPGTPGPEKVRDAFAGLQATLGEACTPGNCAYFLGRVHDELHRMDRAMKADPKGPGHFPEPVALIEKLDATLGGDRSFDNLKKHQTELIATRDEINTWMQGHPDDYR